MIRPQNQLRLKEKSPVTATVRTARHMPTTSHTPLLITLQLLRQNTDVIRALRRKQLLLRTPITLKSTVPVQMIRTEIRQHPDLRAKTSLPQQLQQLNVLLGKHPDTAAVYALVKELVAPYRKLPEAQTKNLDKAKAIALMVEQPSMMKRPMLDLGAKRVAGFKQEIYKAAFDAR